MSGRTPIGKPAPLGVRIGGKGRAPKGKAGGVDRDELARISGGQDCDKRSIDRGRGTPALPAAAEK